MKIFRKNDFFVVIIGIGLISLIPVFTKFQDLLFKNIELKSKMGQVTKENRALMERQHKMQTDPVFAESIARNKLDVAREGEVIYKILPEE